MNQHSWMIGLVVCLSGCQRGDSGDTPVETSSETGSESGVEVETGDSDKPSLEEVLAPYQVELTGEVWPAPGKEEWLTGWDDGGPYDCTGLVSDSTAYPDVPGLKIDPWGGGWAGPMECGGVTLRFMATYWPIPDENANYGVAPKYDVWMGYVDTRGYIVVEAPITADWSSDEWDVQLTASMEVNAVAQCAGVYCEWQRRHPLTP